MFEYFSNNPKQVTTAIHVLLIVAVIVGLVIEFRVVRR